MHVAPNTRVENNRKICLGHVPSPGSDNGFGDATIAQHRVDKRCRTDNMAYASDRTHITNAQTLLNGPSRSPRTIGEFHESGRYSRSVSVRPVILAGVTRVHEWELPRVRLSQIVDIFSVNEETGSGLVPADVHHRSSGHCCCPRERALRLHVALHVEMFRVLARGSHRLETCSSLVLQPTCVDGRSTDPPAGPRGSALGT